MSDAEERFNAANKPLFHLPVINHPVTPNEIHAMMIGLSGYLFATMWQAGIDIYTIPLVLILPAYAIIGHPILSALPHDDEEYKQTIGLKTVRCEPWWFLSTYLLTFVLVVSFGL